jgi:NAD(P)-dependent dehydrogenase (short-subunit alcohol dehydrogenase family)
MRSLDGKVAVITGAGSGIGRASALRFADEGAAVLVTDLYGDTASRVVEEIVARGGTAQAMQVDVGDYGQVCDMIEAAVRLFGRLDVLYNNAVDTDSERTARGRDFLQFDPGVFEACMRINVVGGVVACKHAIPHMLKQGDGGSIIFTSSASSLGGDTHSFNYGATKAALNWYVRSIAATFGMRGIRCNAILPGVITTPAMLNWATPNMMESFRTVHNAPRLGRPEDVAAMALFLASNESAFVNGALLRVDGGMSCMTPFGSLVQRMSKANAEPG